jgi:alkylation response protein AidB-like acyl-CoA dehydrogenase
LPEPEPAGFRDRVAGALPAGGDTRALWRGLGRAGVLAGLSEGTRPEVDPGRLGDLLAELDARRAFGSVLAVCVQVATAIPLLRALAGHSALAGQVLGEALRGDVIVALAATDAGLSGSALLHSGTEVRDAGDDVLLRGGKEWITNVCHCDHALVLARCRPAHHFTSFTWVLVPAGRRGLSCRPASTALFEGAGLGHVRFDDVLLGREHVVGRPGRAMAEFVLQMGTERLAGALWARALCRRVLADTHRYLRDRSAGDGPLWDNAAVQERFARCLVEWRRLDALCAVHRAGEAAPSEGLVLKAACGESVDRILGECVGLRGADAFRDGGVASVREQSAIFGIAGGATGAMLAGIAGDAERLLRDPA